MDNSNPYLDQFVVENLDDIIVYSHSLEVWNPEYSVPGVAGKEAVRETVLRRNFLGHWISKGVIQMDQEKIRSVVDWEVPKKERAGSSGEAGCSKPF